MADKNYYIILPNGKSKMYSEKDFNTPNVQNFINDKNNGASVLEQVPYDANDKNTRDTDVYTLTLENGKSKDYSSAEFNSPNVQKWLGSNPKVSVSRFRPYNPYQDEVDQVGSETDNATYIVKPTDPNSNEPAVTLTAEEYKANRDKYASTNDRMVVRVAPDGSTSADDFMSHVDYQRKVKQLNDFVAANKEVLDKYDTAMEGAVGDTDPRAEMWTYVKNNPDSDIARAVAERERLIAERNANPYYQKLRKDSIAEAKDIINTINSGDDKSRADKAARKYAKDAEKLLEAPEEGENSGFKDFRLGHRDTFNDADFWTAGISAIVANSRAKKEIDGIREKLQGKPINIEDISPDNVSELKKYLNDDEIRLLQSLALYANAQSDRALDTSNMYQAGKTAAQSLEFMVEFFATGGISSAIKKGVGSVASKAVATASRNVANNAARNLAVGAIKGAEIIATPALQAAATTYLHPSSWRNVSDAASYQFDQQTGELAKKDFWTAFKETAADNFIETWSEMALDPIYGVIGEGMGKIGKSGLVKSIKTTPLGQFSALIGNNVVAKTLRRAGFHGYVGEMLEEVLGAGTRQVFGVDDQAWEQFWDKDNLGQMAVAFLPMSLVGAAGGSLAHKVKARKTYNQEVPFIREMMRTRGYSDAEIDEKLSRKVNTMDDIADNINDVVSSLNDIQSLTEEEKQHLINFADGFSSTKLFDAIQEQQKTDAKDAINDELEQKIGPYWLAIPVPADGEEHREVREIKYADGRRLFIISTEASDGQLAAVDKDGKHIFINEAEIASGVNDGSIISDTQTSLNDFLNNEREGRQKGAESARIDSEYKDRIEQVRKQAVPGATVNIGTAEAPVSGTIIGWNGEKFVVQSAERGAEEYDVNQMAQALGVDLHVNTDAENEAQKEKDAQSMLDLSAQINEQGKGMVFTDAEGQKHNLDVLFDTWQEEDGTWMAAIMSGGEEYDIPMADLSQQYSNFLANKNNPVAETDETEPAESESAISEPEQDNTPRDFRGNPLPLKEDGSVNQTALWNNDPEAWAKWNDENPNKRIDTKAYIQGRIDSLTGDIKKLEKAIEKETKTTGDFDAIDKFANQIDEKRARQEQLQEILDNYAAAEKAEAAKEKARQLELNEPQNITQLAVRILQEVKAHSLNRESFKKELGWGNTELAQFFPWWAKKGQGITLDRLAEVMAERDGQYGFVPMVGDAEQKDTQVAKDALIEVMQTISRPGELRDRVMEENKAYEDAQKDAEEAAVEAEIMSRYGLTIDEYNALSEEEKAKLDGNAAPGDEQRKTWLLTAFEKKNSALDNTTDTGETLSSERNDTATPQNTVSESKDTQIPETAINPEEISSEDVDLNGQLYNIRDLENQFKADIEMLLSDNGIDAEVVGVKLIGSRINGTPRVDSDLDLLVEYKGDYSEDSLFNLLNSDEWEINGVKLDINPITEGKSGTIEQFMKRNADYVKTETEIEEARQEVDTNPSDAQKEAGNYKMGHVKIDGYDFTMENPKGSVRKGVDRDGTPWEITMNNDYGYIRGTRGVDGDHIDMFLSDNPEQGNVYVVDQINPDGSFDEHKVMYGFNSAEEAAAAYLANYSEGWQGLGAITPVSKEEFKKWIESSTRKTKPFAEYASVEPLQEDIPAGVPEVDRAKADSKKELDAFGEYVRGIEFKESKFPANVQDAVEKKQKGGKRAESVSVRVALSGNNLHVKLSGYRTGSFVFPDAVKYGASDIVARIEEGIGVSLDQARLMSDAILELFRNNNLDINSHFNYTATSGTVEADSKGQTNSGTKVLEHPSTLADAIRREDAIAIASSVNAINRFIGQSNDARMIEATIKKLKDQKKLQGIDEADTKALDFYLKALNARLKVINDSEKAVGKIESLTESIGVPVKILRGVAEISNPEAKKAFYEDTIRGALLPRGWFNTKTNEVELFLPGIVQWSEAGRVDSPEKSAQETYLHEVVAHYGLRQLLGDKFDSFMDSVWEMMGDEERKRWERSVSYIKDETERRRVAADEYVARIAEKLDANTEITKEEKTIWQKIVEAVKEFLGIESKLNDEDISSMLYQSIANLQRTNKDAQTTVEATEGAALEEEVPVKITAERKSSAKSSEKKIDDFGEEIAGARKNVLKTLAKSFDDATEESLVALPLGKVFKRPDLKKLVEAGTITPDEARWAEAIMESMILIDKPRPDKHDKLMARRAERSGVPAPTPERISRWAKQVKSGIDTLKEFLLSSPEERAAMIESFGKIPEETLLQDRIDRAKYRERNGNDTGDLHTPNRVWVISRVLEALGYQPGERVKLPLSRIEASYNGKYYELKDDNGRTYRFVDNALTIDEAINGLVQLAKAERGDDDVQFPMKSFRVRGEEPIMEDSGKFTVMWTARNGGVSVADVENEDEADKKIANLKAKGITANKYPIQQRNGYKHYRVMFFHPLTGEELPLGLYDSLAEAQLSASENYDENNASANEQLSKKREAEGGKVKKSHVPWGVRRDNNGKYSLYIPAQMNPTGQDIILAEGIDSYPEAGKYFYEHEDEYRALLDEYKSQIRKAPYFSLDVTPRKGKDYRNGKDVEPEQFSETFGFRGVQFGNWTNNADRQAALNEAYDSFMDLADVLGLSPRAMSLGGELGLAFGARGTGSALAHYELNEVVINLTKTRGAGSLAHEWWHALDNYFSRRGNVPLGMVTYNMVKDIRPEVAAAYKSLVSNVSKSNYARRSAAIGEYWGRIEEVTARLFAEWVDRELAKQDKLNHFLSRGIDLANLDKVKMRNYALFVERRGDSMPYEEFEKSDKALAGFPYPIRDEVENFSDDIRNIFNVIQEEPSGNGVLFSREVEADEDEKYMKAVEYGDIDTMQRMVYAAANRAGYDVRSEHRDGHGAPGPDVDREDFTNLDALRQSVEEDGFDTNLYGIAFGVSSQPDSYFTDNGPRWFGFNNESGLESFKAIRAAIDKTRKAKAGQIPTIKVYRAVPNTVKPDNDVSDALVETKLRAGDWVSPSRSYVVMHGDSRFGEGTWHIIEQDVPVTELWWDGNDIREWGWDDGGTYAYKNVPNNIKSMEPVTFDDSGKVIPLSQRFDEKIGDTRFSRDNENQRIFISNAEQAVEGLNMGKAAPEAWLKAIQGRGGLKAGEDKWLGLSEWLQSSNKKSITKEELLDFIRENQIRIEEVNYSENQPSFENIKNEYDRLLREEGFDAAQDAMKEKYGDVFGEAFDDLGGELILADAKKATEILGAGNVPINDTRLGYTTKGLNNKREIALTVPSIKSWNERDDVHFGDAGEGRAVAWIRFGETTSNKGESDYISLKNHLYYKYSTHDEKRLDYRMSEEDRKLLFEAQRHRRQRVLVIDEIQSKRHQEGREKGYAQSLDNAKVGEFYEEEKYGYDMADVVAPNGNVIAHIYKSKNGKYYGESMDGTQMTSDRDSIDDVLKGLKSFASFNGIPGAPFEKNWHELAMKRMLRLAAEEGFDYVAWTTGEQQADRYDLSKSIESIAKSDSEGDSKFFIRIKESGNLTIVTDKEGIITQSTLEDSIGKPLSDLFGKETAIKMLSMENGNKLEEEGLRFGGEGMKGFYDDILPRFMDKYGKKWGVKTQDIELPNLEESARTMHAVPVTDEMKKSVMEGQTMFSRDTDDSRKRKPEEIAAYNFDRAAALVLGSTKEAREYRKRLEFERKQEATELYTAVLKKDFSDVTLRLIDKYINDATPKNPYGRRISKRLPQELERGLHEGARTNAVDALFSRISEGAVPPSQRTSQEGRRRIEETKKELLKEWAIASGNWHTSVSDFTNSDEPFDGGKDSDVYPSKDPGFVIKVSKGKPYGKRFRPDIDSIALFNHVFPNTAYEIVGYGEIDGSFVRFLKQPVVIFNEDGVLSEDERVAFMSDRGFEPMNDENTAFTNRKLIVADLRGKNIVRDLAGNESVIDADMRLHTKDFGGEYDYPPVEDDILSNKESGGFLFSRDEFIPENRSKEVQQEIDRIVATSLLDGTFHKAPNGKESNLSLDQWAMVRTKAFKNWFGDWINVPENASKVVDENGEPKVLYHGTPNDFTEFDRSHIGETSGDRGLFGAGFYFNDKEGYVKMFATARGANGYIIPAFLNIRNPYIVEDHDIDELSVLLGGISDEELQLNRDYRPYLQVKLLTAKREDLFSDNLQKAGYDGVMTREYQPAQIVAFSPNQIKSATDNNGEFNTNNPDIRFSRDAANREPQRVEGDAKKQGDNESNNDYNKYLLERAKGKMNIAVPVEIMEYPDVPSVKKFFSMLDVSEEDWTRFANELKSAMYAGHRMGYFGGSVKKILIFGSIRNNEESFDKAIIHECIHQIDDANGHQLSEKIAKLLIDNANEAYPTLQYKFKNIQGQYKEKDWKKEMLAYSLEDVVYSGESIDFLEGNDDIANIINAINYEGNTSKRNVLLHSNGGRNAEDNRIGHDSGRESGSLERAGEEPSSSETSRERRRSEAYEVSASLPAREAAANATAEKLGVKVNVVSRENMPRGHEFSLGTWIDGENYICPENCADEEDVAMTVIHEAVGHNGLRKLVGNENMDNFCMDLFRRSTEDVRRAIIDYSRSHGYNFIEGTEEYLAHLAETMNFTEPERTFWDQVKDAVRNLLAKVGINIQVDGRDLRWLLWQSYNANKRGELANDVARAALAHKLGFTLKADRERDKARRITRDRVVDEQYDMSAAAMYNRAATNWRARLKETWVDQFSAVDELVKAIEKASGKPVKSFEDVRKALNQQSSKGLKAMERWESEFYAPLMEAIKTCMDVANCRLEDVERYIMLKHGLERNEKFAKRDAREFYQAIFDAFKKRLAENDQLDDETKEKMLEKEQAKFDKHLDNIENGTDRKYREFREKDYGGLTSLYSDYNDYLPFNPEVETEEEFNERVNNARKPRFETLAQTELAAEQEVKEWESKFGPSYIELWARINAATKDTLKHQYESNMLSKTQYEYVRDMFDYYVPLRGFKETTAEDMYSYYMSDQSRSFEPPLLKAKGRSTEAESPFGHIGAAASSAIAADMKNLTKLALYYFVSNRAKNDLVTISDVWYEKTGEITDDGKSIFTPVYPEFSDDLSSSAAKQAYEDWDAGMQEKAKSGLAYKGRKELNLHDTVISIDAKQERSHVIKFKVGGEDKMMFINGNPRAAQAINGELNVETSTDYQKVFGKVLRWFSGINTSYNPEFWLSNMQRDTLMALMSVNIKEDAEYNAAFRKNFGKAIKSVVKMSKAYKAGKLGDSQLENWYREFAEGGGITGYTTLKKNEEWELELRKFTGDEKKAVGAIRDAFDKVQEFGEAIEQMTRFAAFMTSREQGKSIVDSVADAKELTVNFNRKGSGKAISWKEADKLRGNDGRKLSEVEKALLVGASWLPAYGRRFIMFFNASVQGLNTMYNLYKSNKGRFNTWTAAYLALGMMNAAMHALLDDDDDYLDIPDYERRNNLLVGAGGTYFKWAMPQETRIFYGLGDMIVNHLLGRTPDKNILAELLASVSDIAPLNPAGGLSAIAPSALTPIVELAMNRDYKGSRIYNDMQYLSDEEKKRTPKYLKAYKGTGRVYINISQALNWLSGGDYTDAGFININPAAVEHLVEGATGGAGTTIEKFIQGIGGVLRGSVEAIAGDNFEGSAAEKVMDWLGTDEFMVRNTPFLRRILTINDERYRNAHTTDLFNYYKAEAEHTKKRMNQYIKAGDEDGFEKLMDSGDIDVMNIYNSYKSILETYNTMIREAGSNRERKELVKEQDEYRKEMIKEISEIK